MFILILKTVFLGIIEGITEFLPISSTGHMIIVEHFLHLTDSPNFNASFEVIIQLGAIMSVVIYFWDKLWPFSGSREEQNNKWMLWFKVVVAVLPAVVLGLLFDDWIEAKLFNPLTVSLALLIYGVIIIAIEILHKPKKSAHPLVETTAQITFPVALGIGLFQTLAMVPGTSRSAVTIIGGMLLGLSRVMAAEFSFFLAIPTMVGATLLKIVKNGVSFSVTEWIVLGIGFVVSFAVAFLAIRFLMNFLKKNDFKLFGIYRIVLALAVLLILVFKPF